MSKYTLRLTGQDWRRAKPGEADACLIAVGLRRELGGNWTVAGRRATEWDKGGTSVKRQLRLGSDARWVMRWFDLLGIKTGSKVTLYGSVKQPRRKSRPQQGRRLSLTAGSARIPAPPGLPSLRELRGMQPNRRQAALRRVVTPPEAPVSAPEPAAPPAAPVTIPSPPRPTWPVPAPREVEPVSHKSAIPDHVPDHLVQREQARATDRS